MQKNEAFLGRIATLTSSCRLYTVEVVVLAFLLVGVLLLEVSGRHFAWIIPQCLVLVVKIAAWVFPCVVLTYLAEAFQWRHTWRRALLVGYYAVLAAALIAFDLVGALLKSQFLARVTYIFRQIAWINAAALLVLLASLPPALRRYGKEVGIRWWSLSRQYLAALRLCISLAVLFAVYSNLKVAMPLLRPGLYDHLFYAADRALFLGHDPLKLISSFRPHWFITLMHRSYFFLFFFISFGLSGSLFFGSARYMERSVLALALAYIIGLAGYYLAPSVGPAFYDDTYELFRHTANSVVKMWLYNAYIDFCQRPYTASVAPFQGLAAFPSLHVAQIAVFIYYLWGCEKFLVGLLALPALLLTVATVYLGWHYVVDLPAGLLVAYLAIRLERYLSRRREPAKFLTAPVASGRKPVHCDT